MGINLNDFDINYILPDNFDKISQHSSITNLINDWTKLIKEQRIKELKELRLKKINEINAKYK